MKQISVQTVDPDAIQAAVRQAVNEELAAARADEAAHTGPQDGDAEQSAAVEAKLEAGHRVIAEAVTARRWGNEQAARLRDLGTELTGEQYRALVQPLVLAINSGQVEVNVEGPFF